MRYALIQSGRVATVVEQGSVPEIAGEWVAVSGAYGPGDLYSGGAFSRAPMAPRRITVGGFFDRFGSLKWGILASADASVQALVRDCMARTSIDLDSPQVAAGVALLISAGFAVDAAAIIAAPLQPIELP